MVKVVVLPLMLVSVLGADLVDAGVELRFFGGESGSIPEVLEGMF